MKKTIVFALTALTLLTMAGAAGSTGQMFRIEFTVYENNTFTYLYVDMVNDSAYRPYPGVSDTERYAFEFLDADGNLITSKDINVHFAEHSNVYLPNQTDGPTLASTFVHIPVVQNAERLRITHDGNEIETVNLVDSVCTSYRDETCNQFCGAHDADPDCERGSSSGSTVLLVIGVLLILGGIAGGGYLYWRKQKTEEQLVRRLKEQRRER